MRPAVAKFHELDLGRLIAGEFVPSRRTARTTASPRGYRGTNTSVGSIG